MGVFNQMIDNIKERINPMTIEVDVTLDGEWKGLNQKWNGLKQSTDGHSYEINGDLIVDNNLLINLPCENLIVHGNIIVNGDLRSRVALSADGDITAKHIDAFEGISASGSIVAKGNVYTGSQYPPENIQAKGYRISCREYDEYSAWLAEQEDTVVEENPLLEFCTTENLVAHFGDGKNGYEGCTSIYENNGTFYKTDVEYVYNQEEGDFDRYEDCVAISKDEALETIAKWEAISQSAKERKDVYADFSLGDKGEQPLNVFKYDNEYNDYFANILNNFGFQLERHENGICARDTELNEYVTEADKENTIAYFKSATDVYERLNAIIDADIINYLEDAFVAWRMEGEMPESNFEAWLKYAEKGKNGTEREWEFCGNGRGAFEVMKFLMEDIDKVDISKIAEAVEKGREDQKQNPNKKKSDYTDRN